MSELAVQKSLSESEAIIKSSENFIGMGFYNIGNELKYIRDNKTYTQKNYSSFEEYVENELDYSRRSAYNFLEITEKYNVQAIAQVGHLGMTKLLTLAQLDEPKREQFIQSNQVDEMTTRELQAAIKAKKEAERKAKDAESQVDDLVSEVQRLNTQLSKQPKVIKKEVIPESLLREKGELQAENERLKLNLEEAQEKANKKPQIVEVIPPDYEKTKKELAEKQKEIDHLTVEQLAMKNRGIVKISATHLVQELGKNWERLKFDFHQAKNQDADTVKFIELVTMACDKVKSEAMQMVSVIDVEVIDG